MLSETQVCAGRNCASTDGKNHSPECLAEYEVATLGGKTIWDVPAAIKWSFGIDVHNHQALRDGCVVLPRTCGLCGEDLTHPIHLRSHESTPDARKRFYTEIIAATATVRSPTERKESDAKR
jgi:hypothetical protein